jgi:hypothetical protein
MPVPYLNSSPYHHPYKVLLSLTYGEFFEKTENIFKKNFRFPDFFPINRYPAGVILR